MSYKVDNAIIMCAGYSSRFAPISYEKPKALITVKGEVLVERQIRQLKEKGIKDIYLVCGYKQEMFEYLVEKYQVEIIENKEYSTRNNHSSIYLCRDILCNSYICSCDNYFIENPFSLYEDNGYYSCVYSQGKTDEYCVEYDLENMITKVVIGGANSYYMLGHAFFDRNFSRKIIEIIGKVYHQTETYHKLWEQIYMEHIEELPLKIKKYPNHYIYEFDTVDELRKFDKKYENNSGSIILGSCSKTLNVSESEITQIEVVKHGMEAVGFRFFCQNIQYEFQYVDHKLIKL